jgi:hypothetical protein
VLRKTRNDIVHAGTVVESEDVEKFPENAIGALQAIQTTLGLFKWLGLRHDFTIERDDFVLVESKN